MEIKRLQDLIAQGGQESGELGKQLAASQKALAEAEEKIRKLQGELLVQQEARRMLEAEIASLKQQITALKVKSENDLSEKMAEIHKLKQTITDGEATLKVTKREAQEKENKLNEEI